MTTGINAYDMALKAVAKQHNLDLSTAKGQLEARKLAKDEIEKSRAGTDAFNKQVDGATKGLIGLETLDQELKAGVASVVMATNGKNGLATSLRNLGDAVNDSIHKMSGPGLTIGGAMKNIADNAGNKPVQDPATTGTDAKYATSSVMGDLISTTQKLGTEFGEAATKVVKAVSDVGATALAEGRNAAPAQPLSEKDKLNVQKGHANGGVTDGPKTGYPVTLHGAETIIPNASMVSVLTQAMTKAVGVTPGASTPSQPDNSPEKLKSYEAEIAAIKGLVTGATTLKDSMNDAAKAGTDLAKAFKDAASTRVAAEQSANAQRAADLKKVSQIPAAKDSQPDTKADLKPTVIDKQLTPPKAEPAKVVQPNDTKADTLKASTAALTEQAKASTDGASATK